MKSLVVQKHRRAGLAYSFMYTQCIEIQHLLNKRPNQQGNIWKHLSGYSWAGGKKTRSLMRTVCPFSTKHNGVVCLPRQQFFKSYPLQSNWNSVCARSLPHQGFMSSAQLGCWHHAVSLCTCREARAEPSGWGETQYRREVQNICLLRKGLWCEQLCAAALARGSTRGRATGLKPLWKRAQPSWVTGKVPFLTESWLQKYPKLLRHTQG